MRDTAAFRLLIYERRIAEFHEVWYLAWLLGDTTVTEAEAFRTALTDPKYPLHFAAAKLTRSWDRWMNWTPRPSRFLQVTIEA